MDGYGYAHRSTGSSSNGDVRLWRDMYKDFGADELKTVDELQRKREEKIALTAEVQRLREELEQEKAETAKASRHLEERLEVERHESTRMQMVLMKAQIKENPREEETIIKRDVIDKANEIIEAMREMREQQQQAFKQVKNLSYAMLKACSQPTPGASGSGGPVSTGSGSDVGRGLVIVNGSGYGTRSPPRSPPSSVAGGRMHSPAASLAGGRQRSPSLKTVLESEGGRRLRNQASRSPSPSVPPSDDSQRRWFAQMQANLEQYGDVEVFTEEATQECMCCNQPISTTWRVRPRKCNHVFHIECLLHWWSEGTCPVCHVSFAPEEAPPEARTERSSSTSAARREAAWKQWKRRSPPSNSSRASSPPSQFRASSPASQLKTFIDAVHYTNQSTEVNRFISHQSNQPL